MKKAQLKIQEMSFMLVAIVLFFVLAGLFALSIGLKTIKEKGQTDLEEQSYSVVLSLAESAELTNNEPNSIDEDKLIVLTQNKDYQKFFPKFSSLRVINQNGLNKTKLIECNLINYPNCDEFILFDKNVENERRISTYVSLCRKVNEENNFFNKCEIAEFIIGVEQ